MILPPPAGSPPRVAGGKEARHRGAGARRHRSRVDESLSLQTSLDAAPTPPTPVRFDPALVSQRVTNVPRNRHRCSPTTSWPVYPGWLNALATYESGGKNATADGRVWCCSTGWQLDAGVRYQTRLCWQVDALWRLNVENPTNRVYWRKHRPPTGVVFICSSTPRTLRASVAVWTSSVPQVRPQKRLATTRWSQQRASAVRNPRCCT